MPQGGSRAGRRTRERILELTLRLFNEFGEPNTTTSLIASELEISPGNLYYHYRNKDEIVTALCGEFEREMARVLAVSGGPRVEIEDIWRQMHDTFDVVWRYRFLYRDLNDILTRNRAVEVLFKRILELKGRAALLACERLCAAGEMSATRLERLALADNLVVVATYWLSYEYVRNPRELLGEAAIRRGAFQVLAIAAPHLKGRSKALFEKLAEKYLAE
ncbi:MAG: TetR/AcrR family transcriptional regulator [Rhodocyclaceae bacterium]|nr:TetR/AcrR family transcriptional regulator [Rhodocyclaceae bacterium]